VYWLGITHRKWSCHIANLRSKRWWRRQQEEQSKNSWEVLEIRRKTRWNCSQWVYQALARFYLIQSTLLCQQRTECPAKMSLSRTTGRLVCLLANAMRCFVADVAKDFQKSWFWRLLKTGRTMILFRSSMCKLSSTQVKTTITNAHFVITKLRLFYTRRFLLEIRTNLTIKEPLTSSLLLKNNALAWL